MKLFWKTYFVFILGYEIAILYLLSIKKVFEIGVADFIHIFFFVGIFGLAFDRCVFTEKIWRYIFSLATIFFLHKYIVMPIVYIFSVKLPPFEILQIMLFSIPFVPIFFGLYIYAWRSSELWKGESGATP